MKYIRTRSGGYQVVLPNGVTHYFSKARYLGATNAHTAAQAYLAVYLATGEMTIPRPPVHTRSELAADIGVDADRLDELLERYDPQMQALTAAAGKDEIEVNEVLENDRNNRK